MSDTAMLPHYRNPPINEVVLGIQFDAIGALTTAHFGLFWAGIRDEYPVVSEHPKLEPAFEVFGTSGLSPIGPQLRIETFINPPTSRFWFEESSERNELMQLQQDRLMHNWRRKNDADTYPRYPHIKGRLQNDFARFERFVATEKLGAISINQCEVTYVNIISSDGDQDPHKNLHEILSIAKAWPQGESLPDVENTMIQTRGIIRKGKEAVARMYVVLQPVVNLATSVPGLRLELTVRGKPRTSSLSDALDLLDTAHESIVNTFAAVTTKSVQQDWGRLDVH